MCEISPAVSPFGRITQSIFWEVCVIRPKRDTTREIPDVGNVERKVAQIVNRLYLELVAIDEEEPAERSEREERETGGQNPQANAFRLERIIYRWSLAGLFFIATRSSTESHGSRDQSEDERSKSHPRLQPARQHPEQESEDSSGVDEGETGRECLHRLTASLAREIRHLAAEEILEGLCL